MTASKTLLFNFSFISGIIFFKGQASLKKDMNANPKRDSKRDWNACR